MNQTRQPAGTPVGGQFAAGARGETGTELTATPHTDPQTWMLEAYADDEVLGPFASEMDASMYLDEHDLSEDEYKLVDRTIDPAHKGGCRECEQPVGIFDGRPVHLDEHGQPELNDARGHDADIDPWTYDGGDVDAVAEACGWGGTAWERYEDARAQRDVEDSYARGRADAAATKVGGIDLTGSAADVRAAAQQAIWDAQVVYDVAGAKAAAADILAEHPDAAYLEMDWEYGDDGETSWHGGDILDANGKHIADFEDFEDEHWSSITDLPTKPRVQVTENPDGTVTRSGDTRYGFMAWEGNKRQGYTAKLDLKAAAAVDLTTLVGGAK